MQVKVSDYIANLVASLGIRDVFMVTGGGAMHLNHSFGTNKKLNCIFNHHEQACAIAAESYYRLYNKLAIANVTSGPGGTNAITGVYGAYVDSIGMLIISGQVKYETTVKSTNLNLRQYGDQELDIVKLVKPITKYASMILDPYDIRKELEKAIFISKNGRPGPVWLDIPLNVQAAKIDPSKMIGYKIETENKTKIINLRRNVKKVLEIISKAKRPVIYAGNGISLAGQRNNFRRLVTALKIPVVTGWSAHDLIDSNNKYLIGRPGTIGDRPGNFAVQNADVLLILGTRLNIRQISYNWDSFAREAYKIWVDIDELEFERPNIKPDFPIIADLGDFIPELLKHIPVKHNKVHSEWLLWNKKRKVKYPVLQDHHWNKKRKVNPYPAISRIFDFLKKDSIVVTANGTAVIVSFQTAKIKLGQRLWSNSGSATMGYDLPASIGAYYASNKKKQIICIAGDGSIMMNIQELQTIVNYNMPIKIFIINNSGYVSIFQTHNNFFNGKEVGGGPKSGVTFPAFEKIAKAFGIKYLSIKKYSELDKNIISTLESNKSVICEIVVDEEQVFEPKLGAKQHPDGRITSPALEDLSPFLSREELQSNMIIPLYDDE
jgi:acetolactate synthase-1/2/3 large subunit